MNSDTSGDSQPGRPLRHVGLGMMRATELKGSMPRTRKACLALTVEEERAVRQRAQRARLSVSEFLRTHLPAEQLQPLAES